MNIPKRIWIEHSNECPYFYIKKELADASPPLVEYVQVQIYDRVCTHNEELKAMLSRVRMAIEEIDNVDDYVKLQAALREEN